MYRLFIFAVSCLALSSCFGTPPIGEAPNITLVQESALPTPEVAEGLDNQLARLGPYDKISIEPFGLPDMLRQVTLDGEGMVSYPLAGQVEAKGLTTTQLARRLEDQMRSSGVRDPRVSVNIVEFQSQRVAVDGQVKTPGIYPIQHELSLVEAIATAGGTTELATTSDVVVFREVNGQQYVGLYNLEGIRRGNYSDPTILPGDRIVVSTSRARAFMDAMQGVTGLITTPLILLVRG